MGGVVGTEGKKVGVGVTKQEVVDVLKQRREKAAKGREDVVNVGVREKRRPSPAKWKTAGGKDTGRGL